MTKDADTTSSIADAAAAPTGTTTTITKVCVLGGPITCVSLVLRYNDDDNDNARASSGTWFLYYGQGPFLHCTTAIVNNTAADRRGKKDDNKHLARQLLVFPHGGSIHGIRDDEDYDYNDQPFSSRTRYESTSRRRTKVMVVFGGRQIAFVQNNASLSKDRATVSMKRSAIDQEHAGAVDLSLVKKNFEHLTVSDWIWDCRLHCCDNDGGGTRAYTAAFTLLVGLAHNTVQLWSIHTVSVPEVRIQARPLRSIQGTTRSISYCMDIFWLPDSPPDSTVEASTATVAATIAVGTVTNEILVWSLSNEETDTTPTDTSTIQQRHTLEHHLPGHEGVIHAVRWCRRTYNHACQRLVSTSDDRSVRLWSQHAESSKWILQWTAWGHTARGWDVAWGQTLASGDPDVVLSAGEDGTLRIWDVQTGNALAVARGHACHCIWSVDTATVRGIDCDATTDDENPGPRMLNIAVTSGNDGTVAFYNLEDRIQGKHPLDRFTQVNANAVAAKVQEKSLLGSWKGTFLVPDDRTVNETTDNNAAREGSKETGCDDDVSLESLSKKKKERRRKLQQQVLIGSEFMQNEDSTSLVVATRSGSLMRFDPVLGEWTFLRPWCKSNTVSVDASNGRCMTIHPRRPLVAIGTQNGDIVVTTLTQQSIGIDQYPSDNLRILIGREHRTVQRLEWLSDNELLSFHVQSIVMWTFHAATQSETATSEDQGAKNFIACTYSATALRPRSTGVVICYAYEEATSSLVVGDTRGSLTLFHIPHREQSPDGLIILPSLVKPRVHQKEHVTSVAWQSHNRILSVGNDGQLVESIIENGQMVKLLAVTIGFFTGLTRIWSYSDNGVVVGGYHGNRFALVDVGSGYEYFSFDTGGRQRLLSLWVDNRETNPPAFPCGLYSAICASRKDGCNEIEIFRLGPLTGAGHQCSLLHSRGISLHGESIFDLCLFPLDPKCKRVALLTGSEDCTSKISVYENGVFTSSKLLPPHASGIRAVCVSTLASGSAIMVVGGKVEVQLFAMSGFRDKVNCDFCVRNLGFGRPSVKPAIDQRLNAVKAVPLDSGSEEVLLVVAGDSSGSCFLYRFSKLSADAEAEVCLLCQFDRPIMAVEIVKHGTYNILLLGTTSGEIVAYCLPGTSDPAAWNGISNSESILRYSAHSMGANTISARFVDVAGHRWLRICSGGDDQSIYCCDVALLNHNSGKAFEATLVDTCCEKGASNSALKGVVFMDDNHLVATGYDQRISIWRLGTRNAKLSFVADAAVDIGDINCLAYCDVGMGKHLLAAGGAGVELLCVYLGSTPTERGRLKNGD